MFCGRLKVHMPLVKLSFCPRTSTRPTNQDLEDNYQLLYEILLRFPEDIPTQSVVTQALCELDKYWSRKLSKSPNAPENGHATLQLNWAVGESAAVRVLLQHIFRLVRKTSGYCTSRNEYI